MKKEKTIRRVMVRWHFKDGTHADQPLIEHEEQLQREYHAQADSDDPVLRIAGKQKLRETAEAAAAKQFADLKSAANSKRPRPGAKDGLRARIQSVMHASKADGHTFKEFMRHWETGPIDGLHCTEFGEQRYDIEDENVVEPVAKNYTVATLRKLYATC